MLLFFSHSIFAAIDLINNLLQVKMRKRYTVDKSMAHVWLQVICYFSNQIYTCIIVTIIKNRSFIIPNNSYFYNFLLLLLSSRCVDLIRHNQLV